MKMNGRSQGIAPILLPLLSAAWLCCTGCGDVTHAYSASKTAGQEADQFQVGADPELPAPPIPRGRIKLIPIGGFEHGGEAAAEISAYDPLSQRLFTVNGKKRGIDILSLKNPESPRFIRTVPFGEKDKPTSVAVSEGRIAAAVASSDRSQRGYVVFLDAEGTVLSQVEVGYEPDMVTFTPDGKLLLIANEGEPIADYSFDAPGSIGVIDVSGAMDSITIDDVSEIGFEKFDTQRDSLDPNIRIFGKNATVSQDLEPEYITVSSDSKTAWVICQEANALAIVDLESRQVQRLVGLGFKDHSLKGNWLDASDKDGKIRIRAWPILGMYQPDSIVNFEAGGQTYLVTANEGDQRDHDGFSEKAKVSELKLDPKAFPNAKELQKKENLGRLQVTNALGDADGDGLFEKLYCHGGRSFSIWSSDGKLVFDSGDQFERFLSAECPKFFNSNNEECNFDNRSDNKGVEPEGVAVGEISGHTYAFIALERQGGVMAYDVTHPEKPVFEAYVNPRNFEVETGDSGPEGILFLSAEKSPTTRPMLVVSNEISGTTRLFELIVDQVNDPNKSPELTVN